jgi:hypothetical protein
MSARAEVARLEAELAAIDSNLTDVVERLNPFPGDEDMAYAYVQDIRDRAYKRLEDEDRLAALGVPASEREAFLEMAKARGLPLVDAYRTALCTCDHPLMDHPRWEPEWPCDACDCEAWQPAEMGAL